MKHTNVALFFAVLGAGVIIAEPALAAKAHEVEPWRVWWSLAWRILNFAVLVFLAYKLGKEPMREFLTGQRDAIQEKISELEEAKVKAAKDQKALEEKIASMATQLGEYQSNLEKLAERQRLAMLDDAEKETQLIVERAGLWAEQQLRAAKKQLASEMLQEASSLAQEKILANITKQDRSTMIEQFADQLKDRVRA